MAGEKAALCATDPPYLVEYTGAERPEGKGKDRSSFYKEGGAEDALDFFRSVFGDVLLATCEDAALYCWHSPKRHALLAKAGRTSRNLPSQVLRKSAVLTDGARVHLE